MRADIPKSKHEGKEFVWVKVPHELCSRIEGHRKATGLTLDEFVFDAISEKLSSIYRERRKKPRL
jgi:hypothetical protein